MTDINRHEAVLGEYGDASNDNGAPTPPGTIVAHPGDEFPAEPTVVLQ